MVQKRLIEVLTKALKIYRDPFATKKAVLFILF